MEEGGEEREGREGEGAISIATSPHQPRIELSNKKPLNFEFSLPSLCHNS